jgi:hypothetical protein
MVSVTQAVAPASARSAIGHVGRTFALVAACCLAAVGIMWFSELVRESEHQR